MQPKLRCTTIKVMTYRVRLLYRTLGAVKRSFYIVEMPSALSLLSSFCLRVSHRELPFTAFSLFWSVCHLSLPYQVDSNKHWMASCDLYLTYQSPYLSRRHYTMHNMSPKQQKQSIFTYFQKTNKITIKLNKSSTPPIAGTATWVFPDMGLISITWGISLYGHKGQLRA